MGEAFPFVEIPDHLVPRVGLPDPGTRIYRAYGPHEAFAEWWEAVCEICGHEGAVSPGGVSMFVNVSRAGVHKRLKEGRLTAFCFHSESTHHTRFRRREFIKTEGNPFTDIPVVECKAWAEQMRALPRAERKQMQWGDGDFAGQVLMLSSRKRKKR